MLPGGEHRFDLTLSQVLGEFGDEVVRQFGVVETVGGDRFLLAGIMFTGFEHLVTLS